MSYRFDYLFSPGDKFNLVHLARVYLKTYAEDGKVHILVTLRECMSENEFDAEIDRLIEELESIKKKIRRKFKVTRNKIKVKRNKSQ